MDLGAAGWFLVDNALAVTIAWAAARRAYGSAPRLERAGTRLMSKAYPNQPNVGNAWVAIDGLPAGSQVAAFGDHAHHTYPLYGRRFQLRGLSADGRWPPQQAELEAAADVSAVYEDEAAVVSALRNQP